MNAVVFFTYIINFSDFNLVSFMPYTYNIPCLVTCHHLSWLKKLSPTHTHPLISICEFSEPYVLLFFELESLVKC